MTRELGSPTPHPERGGRSCPDAPRVEPTRRRPQPRSEAGMDQGPLGTRPDADYAGERVWLDLIGDAAMSIGKKASLRRAWRDGVAVGQVLTMWAMLSAASVPASPGPLPTVQRAVATVIAIFRSDDGVRATRPATTPAERRAEIRRVAEGLFDFDEVAQRALWRHWTERTPNERAEFVQLLKALLQRTYVGKIETYSGESITFVGERVEGSAATVMSRIVNKKTKETTALDYRLHMKDGRWLVYDVVIDGVSFITNYRSQFDRMIRHSSYEAMIQQLRLNVGNDSQGAVSASPRTGATQKPRVPAP